MKVSKAKLAENRATLIDVASRLFQEQGFAGTGVAEISQAAGLSQGGFYGQFASKTALAAEACRQSHASGRADWSAMTGKTDSDLRAYLDKYLSEEHLHTAGEGCPMAAYTNEVARQDRTFREVFYEGFEAMVALMQKALPAHLTPEKAHARAALLVSAMAGSVSMARATFATDPDEARQILLSARTDLESLGCMP